MSNPDSGSLPVTGGPFTLALVAIATVLTVGGKALRFIARRPA